ncbi:hypothetical protein HaLaN_26282, partial [Haematococcus lacustris]
AQLQTVPTQAATASIEVLERGLTQQQQQQQQLQLPSSPSSLLPAPAAPPLLAPSRLTQLQHLLLPSSPSSLLPAPAAPPLLAPSRLTQLQHLLLPSSPSSLLHAPAAPPVLAPSRLTQQQHLLLPSSPSSILAAAAAALAGARARVDDVVSAFLGQQARRAQQSTGLLSGCSVFAAWRGTGSAWAAHPHCHAMFQMAAKRINDEQGRVRLATRKKKGQAAY